MAKNKKKSDQDSLEIFIAIAVVVVMFIFVGILNFGTVLETASGGFDFGEFLETFSGESTPDVVQAPLAEDSEFGSPGTTLTPSSLDFEVVTGQ